MSAYTSSMLWGCCCSDWVGGGNTSLSFRDGCRGAEQPVSTFAVLLWKCLLVPLSFALLPVFVPSPHLFIGPHQPQQLELLLHQPAANRLPAHPPHPRPPLVNVYRLSVVVYDCDLWVFFLYPNGFYTLRQRNVWWLEVVAAMVPWYFMIFIRSSFLV